MMSSTDDFLDVNVWIALSAPSHSLNSRASEYFATQAGQLCFCRVTALGFVRVVSQAHTTDGRSLSLHEAWTAYLAWRALPECSIIEEPPGLETLIDEWVNLGLATSRNWTDLYLAAFAVSSSMRLVTFDRDFTRFPNLNLLLLQP